MQREGKKGGKRNRGMEKDRKTTRRYPLNVRSVANKLTAIKQYIADHDISKMVITKTHIAEGGYGEIAVTRVQTRKRALQRSGT